MQAKQSWLRRWAAAAGIAGAALAAQAEISVDQYVAPYIAYTTYVDWSAYSAEPGHKYFYTIPASEHYRGVSPKYFEVIFQTSNPIGPRGGCFELTTYAAVSGQTANTEILVKPPGSATWVKLSDNIGSSPFSKARFYIEGGTDFIESGDLVRVAAYSPSYHNDHFNFLFQVIKGATSEAACLNDPNVASAFIDHAERVYIRRAI